MIVYAASSDLATWVTSTPDNADSLLRYASILVARACQRNLYTDQPDATSAPVLRDATCAQVASWVALGVDPAKAGTDMPGPIKSSSILEASVTRDTTAATQAAADARDGLCALATDLLQTAGLLWVPVPLGDTTGFLPTWGLDVPLGYGWPPFDPGVDVPVLYGADAYGQGPYGGYTPTPAPPPAPAPAAVTEIPTFDGDFTIAPGDEVWVLVNPGDTVRAFIEPEPAGQHIRLKNLPESQGPLVAIPIGDMLIDGQPTFTLQPGDAFEFDSDGTRLSVF